VLFCFRQTEYESLIPLAPLVKFALAFSALSTLVCSRCLVQPPRSETEFVVSACTFSWPEFVQMICQMIWGRYVYEESQKE
jgi:hypothetical protein